MLHGIASAFLGNHFDDLRTNALPALADHKPGTSPILHLSLTNHPLADPGFNAIWITIEKSRNYTSATQRPGPCHLLLARATSLGGTGTGKILSWMKSQVSGVIAKRKKFQGMQHTHAYMTTRKLPTDRTNLDGTFYTADHQLHRDPELSGKCLLRRNRPSDAPQLALCSFGICPFRVSATHQVRNHGHATGHGQPWMDPSPTIPQPISPGFR